MHELFRGTCSLHTGACCCASLAPLPLAAATRARPHHMPTRHCDLLLLTHLKNLCEPERGLKKLKSKRTGARKKAQILLKYSFDFLGSGFIVCARAGQQRRKQQRECGALEHRLLHARRTRPLPTRVCAHLVAGLPAGGAHLVGVALHVLDGLQHALGLVHAAAERQVVDGRVLRAREARVAQPCVSRASQRPVSAAAEYAATP